MLRNLNTNSSIVQTGVKLHLRRKVLQQSPRQLGAWLAGELETLGPFSVKLGQWVANRPDIAGSEMAGELARLHSNVAPMPLAQLQRVLQDSGVLQQVHVDEIPLASASISQVHRGYLRKDPTKSVAVKVRRPDVAQRLRSEAQTLEQVLKVASFLRIEGAGEVRGLVTELMDSFQKETDFQAEMENMQLFQSMKLNNVRVPKPFPDLCSANVLVMDYLPSTSAVRYAANLSKTARQGLAVRLMQAFVYQLLEAPAVHGDLHVGNYGYDSEGGLVLYDFGNVIRLETAFQLHLKSFIVAMVSNNLAEAVRIIEDDLRLKVVDRGALQKWLEAYFKYIRTPGMDARRGFAELGDVQQQPVVFTPDLLRLVRGFSALEGACADISGEFNYLQLVQQFLDSVFLNEQFLEWKASRDLRRLFLGSMSD